MKNFLDLLAIDSQLDIEITNVQGIVRLKWPLLVNIDLSCQAPLSVLIDGMDVTAFGYDHQDMWRLTLHEPFYQWRHYVTGQGWLLQPKQAIKPLKTSG